MDIQIASAHILRCDEDPTIEDYDVVLMDCYVPRPFNPLTKLEDMDYGNMGKRNVALAMVDREKRSITVWLV